MASLQSFAEQLERCAQNDDEILAFVEAFAKVRLKGIIAALKAPLATIDHLDNVIAPDWTDSDKLVLSGIDAAAIAGDPQPDRRYLHIDVALEGFRDAIDVYLGMTGLSDKQQRVLFPALYRSGRNGNTEALASDVRRLNNWLDWVRAEGVDPAVFPVYQHHLSIHGASQNVGGQVGAMGAVISFLDALNEIAPARILDMVGAVPPSNVRTPEEIHDYLVGGGEVVRAILLDTRRAIIFASDPDVAIVQSLGEPFGTARQALTAYDAVRRQPQARRQQMHEFAVGEVKTATDRNNLHERLALGSRETRDEVRTDRFLMMAILTTDLLSGGTGQRSGRSLLSRDVERFSDVFNLYFAWGWDGGRQRHPEHWQAFKNRVAFWSGLA
jgi:hypothetical protein